LWSLLLWIYSLPKELAARARGRETDAPTPPAPDQGARLAQRISGLALILVALSLLTLDVAVLRPRGHVLAWRTIPLWVASVPSGALGVGLLTEGWRPLPAITMGETPKPPPQAIDPLRSLSGLLLVALGVTWIVVSY